MAFTAGATTFRKARTPAARREDRDVELGIADRPLHWKDAMVRIFGEERGYDTFERLTREGARVGGRAIVLHTVARPGGRRVLESQVNLFVVEYERAAGAKEVRDDIMDAGGDRGRSLRSGDGAHCGDRRVDADRLGGLKPAMSKRPLRLVGGRGEVVGTRLDVSA